MTYYVFGVFLCLLSLLQFYPFAKGDTEITYTYMIKTLRVDLDKHSAAPEKHTPPFDFGKQSDTSSTQPAFLDYTPPNFSNSMQPDYSNVTQFSFFNFTHPNFVFPEFSLPEPIERLGNGLVKIELSTGIYVYHNGSAPYTSKYFKKYNCPYRVTTFTSPGWKEYVLDLPPFEWKLPLGLSEHQLKLFWGHPENYRHFYDTNRVHRSVVWELTNSSARFFEKCHEYNQSHHSKTCSFPKPFNTVEPQHKAAFGIAGGMIYLFQHFFDNSLPLIASLDFTAEPAFSDVSIYTISKGTVPNEVLRKIGFTDIHNIVDEVMSISANTLYQTHVNAVVHPIYFEWYRQKINFTMKPKEKRNKIIFLPRGAGHGGNGARVVHNLLDLIPFFQKIHGEENVIYYSEKNRVHDYDRLIEIFSEARVIIGPHGGAFYNQFFASADVDIVELLPIKKDGRFPDQIAEDHYTFAQMAMWSNTLLLGQRFWRYYTFANQMAY